MAIINLDNESIKENGIAKIWQFKEGSEINQQWESNVPIWDFLDGKEIFQLIHNENSVEISLQLLSENCRKCD